MTAPFDSGYKLLFSHPRMVQDLLCGFVPGDWMDGADFSTLERVNGSYVSDSERQRHDDMVWRLKVKDRWLWVYLILEFQSEPDQWMALRMMVYVGLLAQHLVREGELHDGRLYPILPIVLYNGEAEWRHPVDVADCFIAPPKGLEIFRPRLVYQLVDEARLKLHPMESVRNFVEALFNLGRGHSDAEVYKLLEAMDPMLRAPEFQSLRRAFGIWLKTLWRRKPGSDTIQDNDQFENFFEGTTMFSQTIDRMREETFEKGKKTGLLQGESRLLARLLQRRFDNLPEWVEKKLAQASQTELDVWADAVLTASSLDDVFTSSRQAQA